MVSLRRLTIFALAALCVTSMALAASVEMAYYAPDRGSTYPWSEGAPGIQEYFGKNYRAAGYLYVYVRNDGKAPLQATSFLLDDKPLAELREANQIVWWRLLPNPLAPGMVGEFMLRVREALTKPATVTIGFEGGTQISAKVTPEPNPLRITTLGFKPESKQVFLVAEGMDQQARELASVSLDGVDVTKQCRFLAPKFIGGCSPVMVTLTKPLTLGSFHTYAVTTKSGEKAATCLKTLDGYVPNGSYGYGTYEEYARNGLNSYACFGKLGRGDLEAMSRLGMRGVSMLGSGIIEPWEMNNPNLYAHYLHDEPDCADYGFDKLPHPLRIGQMAMEMEQRADTVRRHNPKYPSFLTVDLTYKPANYFIYSPIADIVNPDCYPITGGREMAEVREVVATCRAAAGARPVTFTYSSTFEGWSEAGDTSKMRFPRPNFPLEQRVMMTYAVGAGARGLFNYIHCSESSGNHWSHGSNEWPDLWNEIGVVTRELERVSPLLSVSHPTTLATSDQPKLWLRTLICGDDAALIVWVNDDYEQSRLGVRYNPMRNVKITLPEIPWLKGWRAYGIHEGANEEFKVANRQITLPRADVAGMILVTANGTMAQSLMKRQAEAQGKVALYLMQESRRRQAEQARRVEIARLIAGGLAAYAVEGTGVGAYGMKLDSFWNPKDEAYNVMEFGANEATDETVRGAAYEVTVPAEQSGKPWVIYAQAGVWGPAAQLTVTEPDGAAVLTKDVTSPFGGDLQVLRFTPPQAGPYTLKFLQGGKGARGGRITHVIYVLPVSEIFAPLPTGE